MSHFFHIFRNQTAITNDAVQRTTEAVTKIWLKSGIPMKSSWLHSEELLKIFEPQKKFFKSKKRNDNTQSNNRKKFCESLETYI